MSLERVIGQMEYREQGPHMALGPRDERIRPLCDMLHPFEPFVEELHRWQRLLNRVTTLDEDPFSDAVELQDVVDAARRLQVEPDKNWS